MPTTTTVNPDPVAMDVDPPAPVSAADASALFVADVTTHAALLVRAVTLLEPRYVSRVLRATPALRKRLSAAHTSDADADALLARAAAATAAKESPIHAILAPLLAPAARDLLASLLADQQSSTSPASGDDAMAVDPPTSPTTATATKKPVAAPVSTVSALPEVAVYIGLLAVMMFYDRRRHDQALAAAQALVHEIQRANTRTLDALGAKIYFYYALLLSHQTSSSADGAATAAGHRAKLLGLHRTATLRNDDESAATLLNAVLASLLDHKQVEQAAQLVAKATPPGSVTVGAAAGSADGGVPGLPAGASNSQHVRYHYHVGRIAAVQLDYSRAHAHLQQAVRKAPAGHAAAAGFLVAATKLDVLVQLLMGQVPERAEFRAAHMTGGTSGGDRVPAGVEAYRQLVLAVRAGDLARFAAVAAEGKPVFVADGHWPLVRRLRHSVIKSGLRQLAAAYSALPLRDVCTRLGLDAEESAEYMVAKAVRDGVVTGVVVDHAAGVMAHHNQTVHSDGSASTAAADVYATREPHAAFHARTAFALALHDASVRAMRFPDKARGATKKDGFVDSEEVRELEAEIQAALEDEGDDF
ncbi:hypothetical protein BC828DRAFT_380447 [Blastocladiella britannica]|nr:hypothetical protein BC828DRAFT_380447 [Blastocladiella britannica]